MSITEKNIETCTEFRIGHAQDDVAKTGVTVIFFPNGARAGVDISGGGPANREATLASPVTADNPLNALVLSGGSAYGLAAADGVMRCLEEHGIGYQTGAALVPLVCQSCIYDLTYGSSKVRPDSKMGYEACLKALQGTDSRMGLIGAGTGATAGKLLGMKRSRKSGLGIHCVSIGEFYMMAVVIANPLGDIYDWKTGQKIAGLMTEDRKEFDDTCAHLYEMMAPRDMFTGNTTIGAVITNADFSKAELTKLASMTRNAYARSINPVGTLADGDSIYALSVGTMKVDLNMAGTLAAEVMAEAIKKAVESSRISDEEYLQNIM